MIITQTPYRISLFGGGTDYPAWYRHNEGMVVGFAINRYCHVGLKYTPPGQGVKYRIVYSKIEDRESVETIEHPAVRGVLRHMPPPHPVEIHHMGDLPAMGGLGASSSFVVGLLYAMRILLKKGWCSDSDLALQAIDVERNVIGEAVGDQDQMFAALGGFRVIRFNSGGARIEQIKIDPGFLCDLEDSLVLAHTGKARYAHEIAAKVIGSIPGNQETLHSMVEVANEGRAALLSQDLAALGQCLNRSWRLKSRLHAEISSPDIEALYTCGLRLGALGGKLLGAGGGGFMLFIVPPEIRNRFIKEIGVPCVTKLRVSKHGARILWNQQSEV